MNQVKWFLILVITAIIAAGCLPNPMLESGKIALNERDYERALRNLDSLVAIDTANAEAWFYKGIAHERLGDLFEMTDAYHKSRSLSETFKPTIDRSIGVFVQRFLTDFDSAYNKAEWSRALGLIDTVIYLNPHDPLYYQWAVEAALRADNHPKRLFMQAKP